VANTTAELLAAHIGRQLLQAFDGVGFQPTKLRVEIDECDGQLGIWISAGK
jgi:hypothetical protein